VLAHINLCLLQIDLNETAAGLQRCEHAVSIEPSWSQSHYWLANAYRRAGKINEAAAASARAAVLDRANVEYAYQAALDAEAVGDWPAALRFADQARIRAPDYKELGFARGFALQKLGRNQEALDEYDAFLRSHPTHVQVIFNSGYALMTMGRCFEAIRYFERTVALRPSTRKRVSICGAVVRR
jgi:tetratricopeptide (TPR) repeat protein